MRFQTLISVASLLACNQQVARATDVFAHVVVGNNKGYSVDQWSAEIAAAQNVSIDAFVLNVATPLSAISQTVANAFAAVQQKNSTTMSGGVGFKLFFSFDYLGGAGPWEAVDVINLLNMYTSAPAYYKVALSYPSSASSLPLVSTFEGVPNAGDWPGIRAAVPGGIFFMPTWTSLGPSGITAQLENIDGAMVWDIWPADPAQANVTSDAAWISALAGKRYLMGVSPWFFTNLPAYNKAWLFHVDMLWYNRWLQAIDMKPDFIEIVSWNDFGESHYIGPIVNQSIPNAPNANATWYVQGKTHQAWSELIPYFKALVNGEPLASNMTKEKLVYWYRETAKTVGSLAGVTGGQSCPSPCFPALDELEDNIYVIALLNSNATGSSISASIGSQSLGTKTTLVPGLNLVSFATQDLVGPVTVFLTRGGQTVMKGNGIPLLDAADSTPETNFNPWVGSVSA